MQVMQMSSYTRPTPHDDKCNKNGRENDMGRPLLTYNVFQQLRKTAPFLSLKPDTKIRQKQSVAGPPTVGGPRQSRYLLTKAVCWKSKSFNIEADKTTLTGATKLVRMSSSSNQQSRKGRTRGARAPASQANLSLLDS